MGLDSYLEKVKKVKGVPFGVLKKIHDINELKEKNIDLYHEIKDNIVPRGQYIQWASIFEEVGYWRKANHIHAWFVENIQSNNDDCEYYKVSKRDIETLLDICNRVIESLENKPMKNITITEYGNKYEFKVFSDSSVAEKTLPTQEGFFFGGTHYDEYYLEDCKYTKKLCEDILKDFDFENYHLCYSSSW